MSENGEGYKPPNKIPAHSVYVIPAQGILAMCLILVDGKPTLIGHDDITAEQAITVLREALDAFEEQHNEWLRKTTAEIAAQESGQESGSEGMS